MVVYGQIVVGAWLRHSGFVMALLVHVALAFGAVAAVIGLAAALKRAAGDETDSPLLGVRKLLLITLGLQVLLGVGATAAIFLISQGFQGQVSWPEALTATLHVGVGAVLLGGTVAANLWGRRLFPVSRSASVDRIDALGAEAAS